VTKLSPRGEQRRHQRPSVAEGRLQAVGFADFLNLHVPPREMLLHPTRTLVDLCRIGGAADDGGEWFAIEVVARAAVCDGVQAKF
jgi:hypothetical protein